MKNRYLHLQRGLTYKLDKNNENEKGPAYTYQKIGAHRKIALLFWEK